MESNFNELIPKSKKLRQPNTQGVLDDLGFFKTPNGSFWDMDEEYFNRNGYDVHGGSYSKDFEYIPGPEWINDLGCYPEEKDRYLNPKYDDELADAEEDLKEEDLFKGDFEDEDACDISPEELKKFEIEDKKLLDKLLTEYKNTMGVTVNNKKSKKKTSKKNSKKKKKIEEDDEGWETVEDDDEEEVEKITQKIDKINKIIKDS
jgi:hypothetical protein